jgi:predicted transcriptional regulator
MSKRRFFSPAEWEVLQYVVEHHPVTARQVADRFGETHGYARTTVLTLMDRLLEKGYLAREKVEGVHQYSPSAPRSELLQDVVRDFIQIALGGSVSPFVAYLTRKGRLTTEELTELRRLVSELEAEEDGDA